MGEPVSVPLWLFLAIVAFALWSLLDRLVYDPQVVAAANVPHEVAMAEVRRYAPEIVPTFNAYVYFRIGYSLARTAAPGSPSTRPCGSGSASSA
jgi:hypothetical protein